MQKVFLLIFILFTAISAQQFERQQYQYLSPMPDARHVAPQASVIIRFNQFPPAYLSNLSSFLTVKGELLGIYSGETKIARDQRTIIFTPDIPFKNNESISVTLQPQSVAPDIPAPVPFEYSFQISKQTAQIKIPGEPLTNSPLTKPAAGTARIMPNGVSVPSDFPPIDITVNDNPDSGKIFINSRDNPPYQLILENSGAPYWYWKVPDDRRDFKPQPNGWLTMMIRNSRGDHDDGYIALDEHHEYVKTFYASNGYSLDEHEFIMTEEGGYLLIGRRYDTVDMSQYVAGGQKNATVRETCIQEYTAADELIFEWRAWDHFDIRDVEIENLQGNFIRFPHMNAVYLDTDGHILLSSRHLSEVTKIHRQTGEIIWRLSGANNDFTFINDPLNGFHSQHAVRALGNDRYTVYDNGNLHFPPTSRAVEYELDLENMTATLVWEYRNEWPQYHSHYMGNAQRLPNGNTLINWAIGELPKLSEVRPNGEKAYEFWFSNGTHCYRTFKYPWDGKNRKPYLIVESGITDVALIFNQFGDPEVDYYNIYAGTSPSPQALLDTSKLTLKRFTDFTNGQRYYFRVTSVSKDGNESSYSNEESAEVNLIRPGENMAVNGDFALGYYGWTWEVSGTAAAEWIVENGEAHFNITSPGSEIYNVQLRQNGIPLIQNKKYLFEFDARADAPKVVEIKVGQDSDPWTNYSKIGLLAIDNRLQHHAYNFTMESPSDFNARIVLNTGKSNIDVYVDNISLKEVIESPVESQKGAQIPQAFTLEQNYPNPFNPATTITYRLPVTSFVELKIFSLSGETVARLISAQQTAGEYTINWDATGYASGVYFYSIKAGEFSAIRKMILLK